MKDESYRYITSEFVSNCFLEALKAKLRNPLRVKIYFCKPRFHEGLQFCHFLWSDGEADYDFSDNNKHPLPWYRCFLFRGQIRQFKHGFAERYARTRNKRPMFEKIKRRSSHGND